MSTITRADLTDIIWAAACYHEAAHAVTGIHFGYPVRYIELGLTSPLLGDAQPGGYTMLEEDDGMDEDPEEDNRSADQIKDAIVVSFAGPAAQAWFLDAQPAVSPGKAQAMVRSGAAGDMEMAGKDLARLRGWGLARKLEREADDVIAACWDSIVAVAEALRDNNGFLSGSQVYSVA